MGKGFKHGSGGAAALNFKVAGGTAQPSGRENTIWVETADDITDWVLAPEQPAAAPGRVWIRTGTASPAAFNAIRNNVLTVCPVAVKQYAGGAWANRSGAVYIGGQWVSFSTEAVYLYDSGDTCNDVTGGYSAVALAAAASDATKVAPAVTYGEYSMVIKPSKSASAGKYSGGIVRTNNKIDCSGYSTLTFEGTVEGLGIGNGKLSLWSEMGAHQIENRVMYSDLVNGSVPITVDVSGLDGSYYIGLGFDSSNVQITVTMTDLRLE